MDEERRGSRWWSSAIALAAALSGACSGENETGSTNGGTSGSGASGSGASNGSTGSGASGSGAAGSGASSGTTGSGGSTGSGASGGTESNGGSGGTSTAACMASGACQAKDCELGCFDADHCASDEIAFWGGPLHENARAMTLTSEGELVLVGHVQLGANYDSDWDAFVVKLAADGSELWSRQLGTPEKDYATSVVVDASGNIYVTGASQGDFEGQTNENPGQTDVFLLKVGPNGTTDWVTLFGTAGNDSGNELALDSDGNVHVAGVWNGEGVATQREPFLATLDGDGSLVTVRNFPSVTLGHATTLNLDAQGNFYVTGRKQPTDSPYWDVFAKKLAPDGNELWSVEWGSGGDDATTGAVLDSNGRLYVVGTTNGAIEGDPAPNVGNVAFFLSLIDESGKLAWSRTYTKIETRPADVMLSQEGDVLVAGSVLGAFTEEDEVKGVDPFLMRLCPDGTLKNTLRWELGSDDWTQGMAITPDGAVLLAGYSFQRVEDGAMYDSTQAFIIGVRAE